MSYRGLLAELLLAECDDRARRRSERRITAAKFPARSPYAASTSRPTQHRSRGRPHPGQVRVGQEGPAAGLDRGLWQRQVPSPDRARHRGCDIRLPCQVPAGTKLANELVEAADEKTLSKTIARYGRVDLLCIDELGYMQLDRRGAELLFQVLTEREENASVAIASTSPSPAGPRPSPTRGSAPPSSTDSPSAAPSSKPAPTPTGLPRGRSWSTPDGTPPPRGVVWNQTNIEPASMPKVVSELTYKRCRIWDLAHIWCWTRPVRRQRRRGSCLAVTQPRRRLLTDGRAAPTLEEGSPWPSCSM